MLFIVVSLFVKLGVVSGFFAICVFSPSGYNGYKGG